MERAGVEPATTVPGFATDVRLPGLLHAVIARPPQLGWRLVGFDACETLRMGGVLGVVPLAPWGRRGVSRLGGVAVLARDTWSASRGRDALQPVWEATDTDGAFDREGVFVPATAETMMEPPSATVSVERDRCTVWTCVRHPDYVRADLAALLALPPRAVTLHATKSAGDSDRTSDPAYAVEAARLSRAMGAPVSLTWTRADDMPFRCCPALA